MRASHSERLINEGISRFRDGVRWGIFRHPLLSYQRVDLFVDRLELCYPIRRIEGRFQQLTVRITADPVVSIDNASRPVWYRYPDNETLRYPEFVAISLCAFPSNLLSSNARLHLTESSASQLLTGSLVV